MKFQFSNVVVVDDDQIGVIVKSFEDGNYYVYVRSYNQVMTYCEKEISHYVYSKHLLEDQAEFYD